ncbi:type II secretion system protein [Dethiothermospora halolimnae]|uniref:type II secretion system protein n=1 Tax=Dethiothermospora halolimnae TaxID=3114390 RepID=UPI003CCC398F
MLSKKINNKKGFTLIELIVVIAILGILAAIAIPRLGGFRDSASSAADEATAATIANAITLHYANIGAPSKKVDVAIDSELDTEIKKMITDSDGAVPTPQDKDASNFFAVVSTDGSVKVYYDNADGTQLYPSN